MVPLAWTLIATFGTDPFKLGGHLKLRGPGHLKAGTCEEMPVQR